MNNSIYQRAHITILKGDKPGAKTYNIENGQPQKGKVDAPFWHDYETQYIAGLDELYEVLRNVRLDPFKYIIRGKSKLGNAGHLVRRLKETFEETPTPWVCFEFDKAEVPGDPNSETAIEYLIANHLPTCFQYVSYIYQWSNSAGLYEVEQLIQHLAIDEGTIKPADRKEIMKFFITVLERAETVVCLDADLSALTRHTIAEIRENEDMEQIINTIEVNSSRPIKFFDLKSDLIAALTNDINAGFSTYVATNSREFTEYFSRYLDKAGVTHLKINSENSHLQEVQEKIQWLGKAADREVKGLVVL